MALQEKRAWVAVVVVVGWYVAYVVQVLAAAGGGPLAEAPYVSTLLWTIGGSIVTAIVLDIVAGATTPREDVATDQRDREAYRFGEYVGRAFLIAGALAAMVMALVEVEHFWIANVIYLGFALSAVLGAGARIVAYRRGLRLW